MVQEEQVRIELTEAEREFVAAYSQLGAQHQQIATMAGEALRNFLTVIIRNHGCSVDTQFSLTADSLALVAQPAQEA